MVSTRCDGRGRRRYGICYTRNQASGAEDLKDVVVSAASARRTAPSVPLCLFSNLNASVVYAATVELGWVGDGRLFDVVLRDRLDEYAPRTRAEAEVLKNASVHLRETGPEPRHWGLRSALNESLLRSTMVSSRSRASLERDCRTLSSELSRATSTPDQALGGAKC